MVKRTVSVPAEGGVSEQVLPDILPVLPLSDLVIFPTMVAPLATSSKRSIRLVDDALASSRFLIAVFQRRREVSEDEVTADDLHQFGCVARLLKMLKFPDDSVRILVQGVARCRLGIFNPARSYLQANYTLLGEEEQRTLELEALARNASERFQEIITLSPTMPDELKIAVFNVDDPGVLSDIISSNLNMSLEERQKLLEEHRPIERLRRLTSLLQREREVLRLGTEIQSKVSESVAKSQREFYLREQLKAIQHELGEADHQQSEADEIDDRLAKAGLPEEARKVAEKEKSRLRTMAPSSPEYGMIRTYLDWLTDLPWSHETRDALDIRAARRILDRDHYDLERIKDRILEYLSVLKLKKDMKGPILCFVGPPGVGKTSLGQSIARALGRKFIRMSLGGVHDEAEIRGHRRTYIGALPGRIIQGIRTAGSRNPVFMLDEVDKVGADFRGDPSSALLEVLDPEQNSAFADHYLNVPFDLSKVLFITTANVIDTIPPPLRDRMEVLELSGYTLREKTQIAARHLVPKQIRAHGLKPANLKFTAAALQALATDYTREAGVRNLEREIANVCRKVARAVAEGRGGGARVKPGDLPAYLGPAKFESEVAEDTMEPGVATGLAWTPTGGDILFVEATRMPGKGSLILTGSLGDVMKESARAALSYVRSVSETLGFARAFAEEADFHIHVPAGAIPKDGPSAGLAVVMALVSLLRGQSLAPDMAFSGEITLRGKVMPVGGIKEKVLAAHRAGIRRIVLPARNRKDVDEIPADVRRQLTFRWVTRIDEAVNYSMRNHHGSRKPKGRSAR